MPAARYWRVVGISTYGGGDLAISEFGFRNAGARVDGAATITSSFTPTDGSLNDLKDGSADASVRFSSSGVSTPGFFIEWDMGSVVTADSVLVGSSELQSEFMYETTLQWRDDTGQWVGAWPLQGINWPGANSLLEARREYIAPGSVASYFAFEEAGSIYTDSGPLAIPNSSVTIATTTAQSKFGTRSLSPTGGNGVGYADFNFSGFSVADQETFTVECWVSRFSTSSTFPPRVIEIGKTSGMVFFWETAGWTTDSIPHPTTDASTNVTGLAQLPTGTDTFVHISIVCGQGFFRVYANGQLRHNSTGRSLRPGGGLYVRLGKTGTYSTTLYNSFDGLAFYPGVEFRTANFTPPTKEPDFTLGLDSQVLRVQPAPTPTRISEYTPPATVTSKPAPAPNRIDIAYGGTATVAGTVKRKADPANVPLRRRVRLYDENGRQFIREVWSDAVTGVFAFENLNPAYAYTAMTYDHENIYRALVIDNLTEVVGG